MEIKEGMRFLFDTQGQDSDYKNRDGTYCTVIDKVDPNLYDYYDVGPMYNVRFDDGFELKVFEDELKEE